MIVANSLGAVANSAFYTAWLGRLTTGARKQVHGRLGEEAAHILKADEAQHGRPVDTRHRGRACMLGQEAPEDQDVKWERDQGGRQNPRHENAPRADVNADEHQQSFPRPKAMFSIGIKGARRIPTSGNASSLSATVDATPQPVVDLKVNFQPDAAPLPAGYTKDSGAGYSEIQGFGWIREDSASTVHVPLDVSPNARDRNRLSDQRLDTLIHVQYPQGATSTSAVRTPAAWEAAVPNGRYDVTMSMGDADPNYDSTHRIRVEAVLAVSGFVPTSAGRFAQASTTVAVSDGRLTVDAIGGTNTKIDFLTIKTAAG